MFTMRERYLIIVPFLLLLLYPQARALGESYAVKSVPLAAAKASLGANVHIGSPTSPTGKLTQGGRDPQKLLDILRFTGISLLRTGVPGAYGPDGASLVADQQAFLAKAGIRLDLEIVTPTNLDARIADAARFAQSNPGIVVAIEGMNEVKATGLDYGDLHGPMAAVALQRAVHSAVRNHPALSGTKIYTFSPDPTMRTPPQNVFGSVAGAADILNIHTYPIDDDIQLDFHRKAISESRGMLNAAPVVVTEGGVATAAPEGLSEGGVSEEVQAKYLLNFMFDNILDGSSAEYIYELIDSGDDKGKRNPENHFGIYHTDGSPKKSADALHNLSLILANGGGAAAPGKPSAQFDIQGLPEKTNKLVLDAGGNQLYLVLWIEKRLWDRKTHIMTQNAEMKGTVSYAGAHSMAFFDPLKGTTAVRNVANGDRIPVDLADHPVIVLVSK